MAFEISNFSENDRDAWLKMWDMADPWCKNNNRPDIPQSNWRDIVTGEGPLYGLALRRDGVLAGYLLYFFCPSIRNVRDECQVRDIFVHPDFRRQGGGTLLMNKIDHIAREKNAGRIFWACNAALEDSLAFLGTFRVEDCAERVFYKWLGVSKVEAA